MVSTIGHQIGCIVRKLSDAKQLMTEISLLLICFAIWVTYSMRAHMLLKTHFSYEKDDNRISVRLLMEKVYQLEEENCRLHF